LLEEEREPILYPSATAAQRIDQMDHLRPRGHARANFLITIMLPHAALAMGYGPYAVEEV